MSATSSASSFIRLHPIDGSKRCANGVELLRVGCTERPSIDCLLPSSDCGKVVISLGKNSSTMIADPTLPRTAAHIVVERVEDGALKAPASTVKSTPASRRHPSSVYPSLDRLSKCASPPHLTKLRLRLQTYDKGFVTINHQLIQCETPVVNEGDILTLQSLSYSYDYVALIHPIADANLPNGQSVASSDEATATVSPPQSQTQPPEALSVAADPMAKDASTTNTSNDLLLRMAQDEFTCAICLEYQVQSTSLVPCGHSFCHACIFNPTSSKVKLKACSVCNSQIFTTLPNRTIDNCMSALTEPSEEYILPKDDVLFFKERSTAASERNSDRKCHLSLHRPAKRSRATSSRASATTPMNSRTVRFDPATFPRGMILDDPMVRFGFVRSTTTPLASIARTDASQAQSGGTVTDAIVID